MRQYTKVMESLQYAYSTISILKSKGVDPIYNDGHCFTIPKSDGSTLVEISDKRVMINGTSFNNRITPTKVSKLDSRIDSVLFDAFIAELMSLSRIKLNHFGISYYCTDVNAELANIKELAGDQVYEEDSGSSTTKWLFIGNAEDPDEPMFELILNERSKPVLSSWAPHFQIDIDTELSSEDLKGVISKHLGEDWIKWSIDVEGIGTPLVMGRLCSIDGLKVYLGIGTDKRDRSWHRTVALKKL